MKEYSKEFIIADIIALSMFVELNEQEQSLLDEFLAQNQENRDLYNKLKSDPNLIESICANKSIEEKQVNIAINKIHNKILENKIKQRPNKTKRIFQRHWQVVAAACIALALLIPAYIVFNKENKIDQQEIAQALDTEALNSKVKLILADGKEIMLDEKSPQDIEMNGGTISQEGKKLTLNSDDSSDKEIEPEMHTIVTERGGEIEFVLADGSRVWLNADSRLEFPTQFTGRERRIILSGEAYFEVVSNKDKPFIVQSHGMNTRVLGTSFNVKAYQDDPTTQTTLISGKVQIDHSGKSIPLNKGFAAIMNHETGQLRIVKADIKSIIAWKTGYYIFNDEDLLNVMRTLTRWYDIEFKLDPKELNKHTFNGRISKHETLEETLERITLAGGPTFIVRDKEVYLE